MGNLIAIAIASWCLGSPLLSTETQASSTRDLAPVTIDILITNNGVVTSPVLQAAEDVASRIFRDARIEIHWTQEVTSTPLFSVVMCAEEGPHRGSMLSMDGPFARTLRTRHVVGGRTSVFYDRVLGHALATHRNLTSLLGTVLAHEIGHMLLPDIRHSSSGLMRSGWDDEDLTHAELGALRLSRDQVDQIHGRLSSDTSMRLASDRLP